MQRKQFLPSWVPTLLVAVAVFLLVLVASARGVVNAYWYQVIEFAALTAISAMGLNLIYGFNGQFSLGHIGLYAIGAYGSALITKDFITPWSGSQVGALSWIVAGQVGVVVALLVISQLRIGSVRERLNTQLRGSLRPYEAGVTTTFVVLVLAAVGLGVGAAVAWGSRQVLLPAFNAALTGLPAQMGQGIVFFLALLFGGTQAALVAFLIGLALLRLGSDYFGIATLGFSVMIYSALQNSDLVIATMKGARGMVGIPNWTTWPWAFGALVITVIIMRNLIHSSHGRAIMSVREDEVAAKTMGVDVTRLKTLAFTFGGFFAGVAGGLYAHLFGFLHPSTFNFIKGFDPLIIIVFGGLGSITGTIVGSGIFALLIEGLRVLLPQGFEDWRFVIYPIILLLVMLLRQRGLLGSTEWGWLRAPLPPARDIPVPARTMPEEAQAASANEEESLHAR